MNITMAAACLASNIRLFAENLLSMGRLEWSPFSIAYFGSRIRLRGKASSIRIGRRTQIRTGVELDASGGCISIGDQVFINRNVMIVAMNCIDIGDRTKIGPNVAIYDHDHAFGKEGMVFGEFRTGTVTIGRNVWIGSGCVVLRGTVVGDNSVIAAGTVVSGVIPENSLVSFERRLKIRKLEDRVTS